MENGASAGAVFISFAKLHCYKFESVWPMKNDVNQEIRAQTGRNSLQNLRGKQQVRPIWEKSKGALYLRIVGQYKSSVQFCLKWGALNFVFMTLTKNGHSLPFSHFPDYASQLLKIVF